MNFFLFFFQKSVRDKQNKAFESESDESPCGSLCGEDGKSPPGKAQSPSKYDLLQQIRILHEKLNSTETGMYNSIPLVGIVIDAIVLMTLNCFRQQE